MENCLFYAYLKYQKDNKLNVWKYLLSHHKHIFITFVILVILAIFEVVVTFSNIDCLIWSFLVIEFFVYMLLYHFTEKDLIKFSYINYEKYCNYCEKLKEWLEIFGINSYESVNELLQRIKFQISEIKVEKEKKQNRFDKWLQTLVIPIVITMITTIITKQDDLENMINIVVVILIVFVMSYIIATSINKVRYLPEKRRIEQMQCFANDLQGVLDYIKKDKEKQLNKPNILISCEEKQNI